MGITLDVDMYLLYSMFNVSSQKISTEYSGMSVEDIMEAEAAQGNTAAANFSASILNDPVKFIELFGLDDAENKYAILSNMNENDLENLLPYLEQEDLVLGLNFFNQDKLVKLAENLPKEQLVRYTFEMFSPEHLMMLMPEDQINKVLSTTEMKQDKEFQLKHLKTMKPQILAQMIEAVTGKMAAGVGELGLDRKQSFDMDALMNQLKDLPDDKYQEALLNIPPVNKQIFVLKMAKENPKIFELFEAEAFTDIIAQKKEKEDMIKAADVIEPEQLVIMLEELPQDLTALVLTQINTEQFADILLSNFRSIISELVAG